MMDDVVVEIDTGTLRVSRHFTLAAGVEGGGTGPPPPAARTYHDASGHGAATPKGGAATCSPTWVQPASDGNAIYVACNGTSEIVEIGTDAWTVTRRLPGRPGVYNLAVTHDGRLLATNRRDASVSIFDLKTRREAARITTPRQVVHGVVVTPDDRYAFASVEGIGAEPGTVIAIDLAGMKAVAAVDVGPQAGGIDFWKMDR
jgi:DNA-binding beta-propeller fold protein YncE